MESELAPYTTWKVGGVCKAIIFPKDNHDIEIAIEYCRNNNNMYKVIGNGSNILKSDNYFDGIGINISKTLGYIKILEDRIIVGSGCMLPKLAYHLANHDIGNFEFYAGIPGTVGGAVIMNAGSIMLPTSETQN